MRGMCVWTTLGLLIVGWVVFRVFVRRDYLRHGRLTPVSTFLQLVVFFLHAMSAYVYMDPDFSKIQPDSPVFIPAMVCMIVGGALLAIAMSSLGMGQAMGVRVTGLKQTGLYRYSRNPQIIFGFPVYVGLALLWPSWPGLIWIVVLGVILHIMVLTEEEHLRKAFGAEYERYCGKTPRYMGY